MLCYVMLSTRRDSKVSGRSALGSPRSMLLCLAVAARAPPRHESPLQPSACSTCGLSPMRGFANCCLKGGDWEGRCDHGEHSWEEGHLACRHAQHDTAQIEPAGHRNLTKRNSVKRGVAKGQGGQTRACTRCGSNGVGVPNCCSRGGAWEGKCSVSLSEGGKHTWSEGFNACLSVDNEAAPKNSPRNPATQRPGKQAAKQPTTKRPHSEPASKSGQSNRTAGSSCIDSEFGCCDGEEMAKESPEGSNCRWRLGTACSFTAHGCCPDLDIARTDHAGSSCADAAAVVPRAPPAPPPLSPPLFGDTGGCISLKEVMDVWFSAIAPISEADALALCVPATIIAAATTYDVVPEFGVFSQCPKSFNMALGWEAELKGLWQIGHGYDPDPRAQARVVYEMYTSDDNDYGCLSSWCAASGCGETIPGIGQDENSKTFQSHRFCRGVWTGDPSLFLRAGIALGGPSYLKVIGKECQRAKWRHRNPSPSTSHGHGHGRGRRKGKP